jgi:hypothetical protein
MLGRLVFVNQQKKLKQGIAGTKVHISLLPAFTSIFFSLHFQQPANAPPAS